MDDFDSIRRFYDEEYYSDGKASTDLPWHSRRVAARLGDFSGRRVLDVACGTGEWLAWFRQRGAEVSGVDLSGKAIHRCLERFPGGDFHCSPAESLPFDDDCFNLVTCMGSLEHFLDKRKALEEMRRVAAPGARFLFLVPNAGFLTRRLGFYDGTRQTKAREDVLSLDAWRGLLHEAGLHVTDLWRDLRPLSRHWICHGRVVAWPVRAAQALALAAWPIAWQYQVYHYCRAVDE